MLPCDGKESIDSRRQTAGSTDRAGPVLGEAPSAVATVGFVPSAVLSAPSTFSGDFRLVEGTVVRPIERGRPGEGLLRLGPGRCLQRLRCDLRQGPREGGGLLGPYAPQVLRRPGERSGSIGRKNWLFVGRRPRRPPGGAPLQPGGSCRLCGIDPSACLRDILTRISTHPAGRIEELLHRNWSPAHP